jgi:hypothetical protein
MKKLCPREDAPLLEVLMWVESSNTSRESRQTLGVPTLVGSSDPSEEFWRTSGVSTRLPADLITIWIWPSGFRFELFQNRGKLEKIRFGEVSYWDKTTPLYIWEDHGRLSFHLSNRQNTNQSNPFTPFLLSSNLHVVHPLIHDQGWRPSLASRPRQPIDVLILMGSLPGESFDGFFASLLEN